MMLVGFIRRHKAAGVPPSVVVRLPWRGHL